MKNPTQIIFIIFLTLSTIYSQSVRPIIDIRENDATGIPLKMNSIVTVSGIVTSSNQFGNNGPGSLQDSSAGISVYGSGFANSVNIGDSVLITSTITHFNGLTQLDFFSTGSSVQVISSGNEVVPQVVTLNDITSQEWNGVELYESKLVQVNRVTINGSGNFNGGTNYTITDATGSSEIRIDSYVSSIIGSPIPSGEVDIIGVLSQYKFNAPYSSGYQIMPRFIQDIVTDEVPIILTPVIAANVTTNSFDIFFSTARNGNSEVRYGNTEDLEIGSVTLETDTTEHLVEITDLEEYTKYYYRAYSTNDVGTSQSDLKSVLTASSNPTIGAINVYFNYEIDHSVAIGGNEASDNADFQELVITRINQAVHSIDLALYSFFGLPDVEAAIIAAKNRGVKVRLVYDQRTMQSGIQSLLDAGILMSQKPDDNGLMHNKFAIFDARDEDPSNDWVWTGSWNWTSTELSWLNNVVEINDPSLAENYTIEFEEMWGSNTDTPDSNNAKFGDDKIDNTNHTFTIGGIEVESYFSPSDQTESFLVNSLETADTSIYFALLAFTSDPLSAAIESQYVNHNMNDCRGLISDANNTGSEFEKLAGLFPNEVFDHGGTGVSKLHHKFGTVDVSNPNSDPQIITGSHNWSAAANERNDENTLIIHDLLLANQYMQAFKPMYNEMGGTTAFHVPITTSIAEDLTDIPTEFVLEQNYPNPFNPSTEIVYSIPIQSNMELKIYDVLGREVATLVDQNQNAGKYSISFDASNLTSGLYIYRLTSGASVLSRKMILLK